MNDYVPASTLGWLDLGTAASKRVATLLRSLEEPSTLDVLGLGTVRDAFADMLSPGTSTVQTRLRYFIRHFLAFLDDVACRNRLMWPRGLATARPGRHGAEGQASRRRW